VVVVLLLAELGHLERQIKDLAVPTDRLLTVAVKVVEVVVHLWLVSAEKLLAMAVMELLHL
jgi:hypothetical protein